jgi:hypothetical protein
LFVRLCEKRAQTNLIKANPAKAEAVILGGGVKVLTDSSDIQFTEIKKRGGSLLLIQGMGGGFLASTHKPEAIRRRILADGWVVAKETNSNFPT